jgi:hypothetical protein
MAHDVFVSYANKDKPVADAVVAGLESAEIRCWYAPRDIDPGSSWGEAINTAIENSRFMVILLSEKSNRSNHVVREVERAVANDVIIIPFRIEQITPTGAMAYFLSTEHWLDALTPPIKQHIDELVRTIQRFQAGGERKPSPSPSPERKPAPTWLLIGAAVLIPLVVLAAVFLPRWLAAPAPTPTARAAAQLPSSTPLPSETPSPTPAPSFTLLGSWPSSREVQNVFLDGETAYAASGDDGLVILDLSNPAAPVEMGRFASRNAKNVQVVGQTAYLVDQGVLEEGKALQDRVVVLDVSDPADPQPLGAFTPEGPHIHRTLNHFAVEGETLYLVTSDRLVMMDISDLDQPETLGEIGFNSNISSPGMAVSEGIVYIQANQLSIVDARDPANPVKIAGFDGGWGSDVAVVEGRAYLAGWDEGLTVLDVSDPARPVKLGSFLELVGDYSQIPEGAASRQTILDVAVSGERAYLTYRFGLDHGTWTQALESGLVALDLGDPADPQRLAVYRELDETSDVAAMGDLVLVTDSTGGLFILGAPE